MSGAPSNTGSKRPSPPANAPAAKRSKTEDGSASVAGGTGAASASATTTGGGGGGGGGGGAAASNAVDPEDLSDALLSAGVDLKEEENLLSSTLDPSAGSNVLPSQQAPKRVSSELLDMKKLNAIVTKSAQDNGLKSESLERDSELTELLALSCEEWMTSIITDMVVLHRHRRRSRNNAHSDVGRALRTLAIKDKEREDRRVSHKAALGLETSAEDKRIGSEESQYRSANETALMMTGKKKYSWLSAGSAGGGGAAAGAGNLGGGLGSRAAGNETNIRYREAREEPQLAMRDLLGALEGRRKGVEKTLMKGYARLKN